MNDTRQAILRACIEHATARAASLGTGPTHRHVPFAVVAAATTVLLGAAIMLVIGGTPGATNHQPRAAPTTPAGAHAELTELVAATSKAAGGRWVEAEISQAERCPLPSGGDGVSYAIKTGSTTAGSPRSSADRVESTWKARAIAPTRKTVEETIVVSTTPSHPTNGPSIEYGVNERAAMLLGTSRCVPKTK